jgi:small-conductance mechanosensitive channel
MSTSGSAAGRLPVGRLVLGALTVVVVLAIYQSWDFLAGLVGLAGNPASTEVGRTIAAALFWVVLARALLDYINELFWGRWVRQRKGRQVPKLLPELTAVAVWVTTTVVILTQVFDTPVTGFLTASGVVIAVIGFALRGMIADLFTGIALGIEQPIHIDDFIELENGTVGQVVEMNWRATRIITREEITIVIPNNYLAAHPFKNYSRPARFWRDKFQIVLGYEVTAHQAERILLSAVSQIPESTNIPRQPEVRIAEYTPRGPNWELRYWVPDYISQSPIRYQVQRNVLRNLHYSGLAVPREKLDILNTTDAKMRRDPAQEDLDLLRQIHLFDCFAEEELKELRDGLKSQLCFKEKPIVRQGEAGGSLFLVKEGFLDVSIQGAGGDNIVVGHQLPGMFFGEMSLLTGEPRAATVTPSVDSVVLEVSKETLEPLLARRPDTVRILSEALADRRLGNDATMKAQNAKAGEEQRSSLVQRLQAQIMGFFGLGPAIRRRVVES